MIIFFDVGGVFGFVAGISFTGIRLVLAMALTSVSVLALLLALMSLLVAVVSVLALVTVLMLVLANIVVFDVDVKDQF